MPEAALRCWPGLVTGCVRAPVFCWGSFAALWVGNVASLCWWKTRTDVVGERRLGALGVGYTV